MGFWALLRNSEIAMRIALLFALIALVGCGKRDPIIRAERTVSYPKGGVILGPVGAGYDHGGKSDRYEGPESKAPRWIKGNND